MTLHEALTKSVAAASRESNGRKIVTRHECPPIPTRSFDWQATYEDYDMGDPIGFGRTEDEAIADLMDEIEFRAD